jgi:hypothetical protein
VMQFDSAVRAAFSHALAVFPVQKPGMRVMCAWDFEEQELRSNAVAQRHHGAGRSWGPRGGGSSGESAPGLLMVRLKTQERSPVMPLLYSRSSGLTI